MKSKSVDTITSDEELVRLRIYEGDIPLDQAGQELLALAKAEARRERQQHLDMRTRTVLRLPLWSLLRMWWQYRDERKET
jgi:hypothetical protein